MIFKIALITGLALVCHGYKNNTCSSCFDDGTYKCGLTSNTCICHVGFCGEVCQKNNCSYNQCKPGRSVFRRGNDECECEKGFWGRTCEHTDAEVANLTEWEPDLAKKYCGEKEECEPPHLQVVCSHENLDTCDEKGNVRPFNKCPYPWYCFESFRNGKCDWECERSECLYDGYECATNRDCDPKCITRAGTCDLECSLKEIGKPPTMDYGPTTIEFMLDISEQFWWDNEREIIANISEPLRTPLLYIPQLNWELEKNKNSLEKIISRSRRSISRDEVVVVNLVLASKSCTRPSECAADAITASRIYSAAAGNEKSGARISPNIRSVRFQQPAKSFTNGTLMVCVIIIAVPIILIGYRIITAPVWFPPKSEDEAPVVWDTKVASLSLVNGTTTPLHEEAFSLSSIRLPIEHEYANTRDEQGRTPLFWLIASPKSSELMLRDVNELVRAGANPNHSDDKGDTPLSIAIVSLRPSICDRLVQWGADPAAVTHSGASCLHLAVAQDDIKCVQWLLSFPSVTNNINEVDEWDRTPLSMAAQGGTGSASIAEMLISAGADVLHQGNQSTMWKYRGRSALHWAALFNNLEVMKVLLEHRSDVNCVDIEGCAPLHLAVERCSEAAVRMLLEAHANTDIINGLGFIPLSIAKEKGVQGIIDLLTWYTDVRKEGLVMKKKGKKREKRSSYSGSDYSKRHCSDSPFYSDSISNTSGSITSGYMYSYDSSSIGSGVSMTSYSSGSSHSLSWCPLSPSSTISSSSSSISKKTKSFPLPPIHEQSSYLSFDCIRSQEFVPRGGGGESVSGESGVASDYPESLPLSPFSDMDSHGSELTDSPIPHLDSNGDKDGFSHDEELLHEFFVNWPE
ncbi:hypothetical protein PMAYCL1PPCAC_29202 [Pristionchus mayeri]|uniref:Ankyrin repeat-containing protein n=1 Tax=Pristionchus mayeri TaxID=1317129 RepID=A0AAN5IAN0_9BILA|nr:hypothetical protein PMAYCL1PPCAC_29202 [Pristionchus mayeri]